jgi:hypothetical protein
MSRFEKDNEVEELFEDVQKILDKEHNERKQQIIDMRKALKYKPLSEAQLDKILKNEDEEELNLKELIKIEKLKSGKGKKSKKKKRKTKRKPKRKKRKTRRGRK